MKLPEAFFDITTALSVGDYHFATGLRTRSNASRETLAKRTRYGGRKGRRAIRRLDVWDVANGFGSDARVMEGELPPFGQPEGLGKPRWRDPESKP